MTNPSIPNLHVSNTQPLESVERYEFEPIKGYPMLNWKGKRPFTSTHYYPAQLKERYGESVNNWMSRIYWGDNLQVMSHLLKEFRGKINLVYIDPPFDSKADYKKKISLKGQQVSNDLNSFEEKQYTDIWTNDEYLQFMYERLILIRELLADDGSIYVHLNHYKVHLVRCLFDEIFGIDNFKNDIIWKNAPSKSHAQYFGRVKDTILFYTKTTQYIWNKQFRELSEEYKSSFKKRDSQGYYVTQPLHSGKPAKEVPIWRGIKPPDGRGWAYKIETLEQFETEGKIEWSQDGVPRLKRYLHEIEGAVIQDVWDDIPPVLTRSSSSYDYPTEKPEALLERIIQASSNPGDIVFDCFMGSGTTQAVAMKLGRRFIGADINLGAVQITTKRLLGIQKELTPKTQQTSLNLELERSPQPPLTKGEKSEGENTPFYTGFQVYNVNHYDVFRNPLEAKDLLIEALELQKLGDSHLFDGEKEGRFYKIMPVNHIATRKDLNELIAGFDYKTFEKKQEDNPNTPVEKITLVCMGRSVEC